ncbi:MAG: putative signal peptide-containing protein [Nocardioides sp.]|nr:putative signal peptide-containing protein [Nocardioides sp.]
MVRSVLPGWIACCAGLALVASGCSSDSSPEPAPAPSTSSAATGTPSEPAPTSAAPQVTRPKGPSAALTPSLKGGNGIFLTSVPESDVDPGYVVEELAAAGTATAYDPQEPLAADGTWTFRPGDQERYRTRVVVRRPAEATDASGVVLVEWLNVSAGADSDPGFQNVREEAVRQGHTWVGVSAQKIGVEGGDVAVAPDVPGAAGLLGKGLKGVDAARYGSLRHPGDRFAFDIVTQVARALREGGPATGGAVPDRVLAMGVSQSAFGLVTYVNGVQPLTQAFDGFFVISRAGSALPVVEGDAAVDVAAAIFGSPTTLRTDTEVPVFVLQTETDVVGILGSGAARQPDSDLFRLWEVAGTGHADLHLLGDEVAGVLDCGAPVNDGPMHVVAKAALRHVVAWVRDGVDPPAGQVLEFTADGPTRDRNGIVAGGIRTPPVDVPTRLLSGEPGRDDEPTCVLFGSTRPLPAPRLAVLYDDRADFEQRYEAAVDEAVAAGSVLEEDRAALLDYAHPELVPGR